MLCVLGADSALICYVFGVCVWGSQRPGQGDDLVRGRKQRTVGKIALQKRKLIQHVFAQWRDQKATSNIYRKKGKLCLLISDSVEHTICEKQKYNMALGPKNGIFYCIYLFEIVK